MEALNELKTLIEAQGSAFDAFKKSITEQVTEAKKGVADPVLLERLAKIEKSMDQAIEGKTAIENAIAAEKKEREDLEARLNRPGNTETSAAALMLGDFKRQLNSRRADLKKPAIDNVDQKMFDDYKSALVHLLRSGKEDLSGEELKSLQVAIDPQGGYLVTPDTTGRIVKKVYETSNIRQIASVTTIGKDKLEGMEDLDEAGAAYEGENSNNNNEDTPDVGKWDIPVWNIGTHPKASSNLIDDADLDIETWLAEKVSSRFGRFENTEHCVGNRKIRGFTTYDTAVDSGSGVAWGSLGYIKTGANGAFNGTNPAHKLFELIGLLKEPYLNNARFVTRRAVITLMRKMVDTTGQYLWQPSLVIGNPESFGGYPITRAEDMPQLSDNGYSLAFGDFKEGYQIVDRQGIRVLRDPFTANPKVIFHTTKRSGGGVLNFEAIKLLQFAS